MADRKFTVKPGAEIIITVPGKKPTEASLFGTPAGRKGIMNPRRPDEFLPRRLSGQGMNFYDFAWIRQEDDSYKSLNVSVPAAEPNRALPFLNAPLSVEPTAWNARYRRVIGELAEKYKISVRINGGEIKPISNINSDWTANGLKMREPVTELEIFSYSADGNNTKTYYESGALVMPIFQDSFNFAGDAQFKLTGEPAFGSPSVELALSANKSIDVFLSPGLIKINSYDAGLGSTGEPQTGGRVNLPNPEYRWIFLIDGNCSTVSSGAAGYYVLSTTTGTNVQSVFRSNLRIWDRDKVFNDFFESDNQAALYSKAVEILTSMGEIHQRETTTVVSQTYAFGRQDDGGTFGQFLCGSQNFSNSSNATGSLAASSHGNSYQTNSGQDVKVPGSLAAVLRQGAVCYYLWNK